MKEELNWINCVKAICIILVFFAHSVSISGAGIPDWLYWLYDPVYVNAFFFVSGYLLFGKQLSKPLADENRKEYVRSGGRNMLGNVFFRIMVPSVIFAIIEYWPKHMIKGGGLSVVSFLTETVGGGTYWFLSALAVAQLLFVILLLTRIRSIWFYMACSLALAIVGMKLTGDGGFELWHYRQGLVCTLFLAAGGLYQRYEKPSKIHIGVYVFFLSMYVIGSILHDDNMTGYSAYNCNVSLLGFLWSMVGVLCLVEICKWLPKTAILTFIGRNSILFYMMSGSLPFLILKLTPVAACGEALSIIITFLISLAVSGLVSVIIVRHLPFLKDLRAIK